MTGLMTKAAIAAAAIGAASAAMAEGSDLVITEGEFVSVYDYGDRIEFGFAYTLENIGDAGTDLGGADPVSPNDNVSIQTYLATAPDFSGQVRASGGGVIPNPVFLEPGAAYDGVYFANSGQLPNPLDLGAFGWLIVDIVLTDEPVPALANNRTAFALPTPCGRADRAAPIGILDLGDVARFVEWFVIGNEAADYDADGVFDLGDIVAFIETFQAGC